MRVIDAPQGSPEWFAARAGRVTASRISDVLAKGRSGAPSATRAGYMVELIAETLTGQPANPFQGNADTERGVELEPEARAVYEISKGAMVSSVGLVIHPRIERSGASPDGLADADGLLEIKCPRTHTHLEYLLSGEPPAKYVPQMAWQAACAERSWVDFVSYCPAMPEDLRIFIVRYEPSMAYLKEIEGAVIEFLAEMDDKLARIARLRAA
jgi:putative phage-type endonuclease